MTDEQQDDLKEVMYGEDEELKKELVGTPFDKKELLDVEKQIEVHGLGLNQFGKNILICTLDGEEIRLPISKKNKNELIDLLGNKLGDWLGEAITVKGKLWEGEIEGQARTGVELEFNK